MPNVVAALKLTDPLVELQVSALKLAGPLVETSDPVTAHVRESDIS